MIHQQKYNVLGILINAINYEVAVEKIIQAAQKEQPLAVSALAVHGIMTGVLDTRQGSRLNNLDIVVPDGQPVRWALNWLHNCELEDRVYGPTLMLKICARAARLNLPIALYGSKLSVLDKLSTNLKKKFPGLEIVNQQPSLFRQVTLEEQTRITSDIQNSGARIIFVGLGCPRQEVWVCENRSLLGIPTIAVGAAFDFHAGLLAQAPGWMQRRGLEWFFRLLKEPRRLWKRYFYLNPLYLLFLALQLLRIKPFSPCKISSSLETMRYG